ncbi:MAG: protein kinase [Candidatus Nanoarchaeia archaeon]|nr:protein kinase [Candidatus Nanoarchaeia archaeon]
MGSEISLEGKVLSGRYEIGKEIGRGTWNIVYRAKDLRLDAVAAIKVPNPGERAQREMLRRGIASTTQQTIVEAIAGFGSYDHVVPNFYNYDQEFVGFDGQKGMPYLVMPLKGLFLSEIINDEGERKYLGNGLNLETILLWLQGISTGAGELHRRKIVHCDIKPSNLVVETYTDEDFHRVHGEAKLADLGTNVYRSISDWPDPANSTGPKGHESIRAPEAFREDFVELPSADVFSIAAVGYRLITGKYPLERFSNEEILGLSPERFNQIIMDNISREVKDRDLRELLIKNLDYFSYNRDRDGNAFCKSLDNLVEARDEEVRLRERVERNQKLRRIGLYSLLGLGLITLAAVRMATHEPQDLRMPSLQVHEQLYSGKVGEKILIPDSEVIPDLPKVEESKDKEFDFLAKQSSNNRVVAYLVKTHAKTCNSLRGINRRDYTDEQFSVYSEWRTLHGDRGFGADEPPGQPWNVWARSIEYALTMSGKDDKYDLEDACAIARVGIKTVAEAKRISRSEDYAIYRNARYSNGNSVIPNDEIVFINTWLANIHVQN